MIRQFNSPIQALNLLVSEQNYCIVNELHC